jgi:hypothetical protein
MFWRRPALRAGRRLSAGPPPAFGGRRPHKILLIRIQKFFAASLNGVEVLEAVGGLLEVG